MSTVAPEKVGRKKAKAKGVKVKKAKKRKPSANGRKPRVREGLAKPQIELLKALKKAGKPLSRAQVSKLANVDSAMCTSYLGSHKPEIRAQNDKKVMPSLVGLKLVTFGPETDRNRPTYQITATGKKVLDKYLKTANNK